VSVTLSRSIGPDFSRHTRRPILFFLLLFLTIPALLFTVVSAEAAGVTIGWNACTASNVAGYKVYYGTASGNYAYYVDVGNTTSYALTGLSTGATYYMAATAYDSSGNQSTDSNEVSYTVPSGSSCTYSINPPSYSASSSAITGNISVTTQSGCSWTATSGAPWMTINSGGSGTGSGAVNVTVAANTSASSRTMASTIAGISFTLTQAAGSGSSGQTPPSGTQAYTITASAGRGGSISPSGSVSVNAGASKSFSITPRFGYSITSVTVDGNSMGKLSSYTFTNVTAGHTIGATFTSSYASW
jgi:Viral BACON domain